MVLFMNSSDVKIVVLSLFIYLLCYGVLSSMNIMITTVAISMIIDS